MEASEKSDGGPTGSRWPEGRWQQVNSHMAARIGNEFLESENRETVSRKKDRAEILFLGEDEIGLLDIVLMDAIANNSGGINR